MSQQTINTSTATDTLAAGFDKVNGNFTELYAASMSFDTGWAGNQNGQVGNKEQEVQEWDAYLGVGALAGVNTVDLASLDSVIIAMNAQIYGLTVKFCALQHALANKLLPNAG